MNWFTLAKECWADNLAVSWPVPFWQATASMWKTNFLLKMYLLSHTAFICDCFRNRALIKQKKVSYSFSNCLPFWNGLLDMSLRKLDKQQLLSLWSLEFISFEIVMSIKKLINVWGIESINFYGKIIEPETGEHKYKCVVFNPFSIFKFTIYWEISLGWWMCLISPWSVIPELWSLKHTACIATPEISCDL